MYKFTCIVCGKQGQAANRNKVYCSNACNAAAWRKRHMPAEAMVCRFNEGVDCDALSCDSCGWNPAVARAREKEILRRLGV